jgi:AcrR family transcriptional regulator
MTTPRRRPGRPKRDEQRDTADTILTAATALFARKGFDAVGMREVATAAGVDVATVHHHVGTKSELYRSCFARVFTAESQALAGAVVAAKASVAQGPDELFKQLHALLDVFIDFLEAVPETTGLWLRRWSEPDLHGELDAEFAIPLYRAVEDVLTAAHRKGLLREPSPHVAVRSLVWAVHAHVVGGAAQPRKFRAFMHRWLDQMYRTS